MKKIFIAAAFMAFCSAGSVLAQAPATSTSTSISVEKADETQADTKKETKAASCCSKKSAAKSSCADAGKTTKKSSCCQKAGHTDAKAEGTEEKAKTN
ncbi:MAG: hypothetical protein IPP46_13550 [Bacteroidetes bacterium]|nr:hypothetical protein [Bacteroidota bacterium]